MKLLVVGAGSIGSRHARNAREFAEVSLCDSDRERARRVAAETGARPFADLEQALAAAPRAAIVATPDADHVATALRLIEAGCDVLVEKPLSDRLEPARRLVQAAAAAGRKLYVACNLRFHPGPARIRTYLPAVGAPWYARAHFGQWLPAMRPGADYRRLYCAGAGGGVILDTIHEIDCLHWLFGPVRAVSATAARLSDLEIRAEDYAAIQLEHDNGVRSEIHLDYLQACRRRGCEVTGSAGTLLWESEGVAPEACRVRLFRRGADCWETLFETDHVEPDAMYRQLLERFLAAVRGGGDGDLLDGALALRELEVALAARGGSAVPGQQAAAAP